MGIYLNPPADGFRAILKRGMYVDKSELIAYINSVLESDRMLTCFSRPRRFGKSFAAKMLTAYYSRGADARSLFEKLKIAKDKESEFEKYLNNCDVLSLDITSFISVAEDISETVNDIQRDVIDELREAFPGFIKENTKSLFKALLQLNAKTGKKFFIIIDEWDALFREAKNNADVQKAYIQMLRSLFKNNQTSQIISGAYMTGILPIKKYGTQSALTDFCEFTMLEPGPLSEFVGFTEKEVRSLCSEYGLDFNGARKWYDGYRFEKIGHVYNPKSIIEAILSKKFSNYWTQTETYESLKIYIDLNYDGLRDAVVDMLGGQSCRIDTGTFQNDMTSLKSRDDVLTLLVHLGYLAYDSETREVCIPNEEVREEFIRAVKHGKRQELVRIIERSDQLLDATLRMDGDAVAEILEEVHETNTAPQYYNNEQALRSVVIMAYISCVDHYLRFEELASGKGYSDILFLPNSMSEKPALLIELKWNKSAEKAITQIMNKDYTRFTKRFGYEGELLLVGINYSTKTRKHTCRIECYRE
ncbi:MAG: AAA family ATPase [Eubacteriales bacterium]|nr:AAA family ATPase [Eubacteriales bacterium]